MNPLNEKRGKIMEDNTQNTKKYNWTPGTVKNRLFQIIESLENNVKSEISEEEIRSLQQFFNEKSAIFLKRGIQEIRRDQAQRKARKPRLLLREDQEISLLAEG